jgi:hypothetical protein
MFSASQCSCDDPLRELLFCQITRFIESEKYAETNWYAVADGVAAKDFFSDAYTYITHDRPLKVDLCIEQELASNDDWANLESNDTRYMQGIVSFRKFLS